jgi:hypothetical protein
MRAAGSDTTLVVGYLDKVEELDAKVFQFLDKVRDENDKEAVALIH